MDLNNLKLRDVLILLPLIAVFMFIYAAVETYLEHLGLDEEAVSRITRLLAGALFFLGVSLLAAYLTLRAKKKHLEERLREYRESPEVAQEKDQLEAKRDEVEAETRKEDANYERIGYIALLVMAAVFMCLWLLFR